MNGKKIAFWLISLISVSALSLITYKKIFHKEEKLPYTTQRPSRRTIKKIIDTTGKIAIADKNKIGSFVTGILKKRYVEENDVVKKGQLLAIIDTGKSDTDVRYAQGALEKRTAEYHYQQRYYERQKILYEAGQLALNEFEKVERDFFTTKGDYISAQATLDKYKEEYGNTRIYAPDDGVIIRVGVAEGERVTTDLDATILFEIAKDITKMEGSLEIDESDVGHIKIGQEVEFTIDTFPNKVFRTTISDISYSPKKSNGTLYYKATVIIDNKEKLLRPGLSLEAKVFVATSEEALALPGSAFMISGKILKVIADKLGYSHHPIEEHEISQKIKETDTAIQTVWVVQANGEPNTFVEKIVTTDLTDDIHFEVISGIAEDDDVIIQVEEANYMDEIMKKYFGNKF